MSRGRAALGVIAAGAAVGAATATWGSLVERRRFGIRWETVPVLPEGSRDVTVLHLSDIHMAPWQADKQQWLRDLSLVEPDFVVNTGDNLGHETANAAVEYALEPFRGIPGAFAHGSNDFYGPSPRNPFKYFTDRAARTPTDVRSASTSTGRRRSSSPSAGSTSTTRRTRSNSGDRGSSSSAPRTRTATGTGSTSCRRTSTRCAAPCRGPRTRTAPPRSRSGSPTRRTAGSSTPSSTRVRTSSSPGTPTADRCRYRAWERSSRTRTSPAVT